MKPVSDAIDSVAWLAQGRAALRRVLSVLLAGCAVLVSTNVGATQSPAPQQPDWFAEPYPYVLVDQDLRSAFSEFSHQRGMMLVLSEKVRGRSRSNLRADSAGQFLRLLSEANHLSWYIDGNVLYVNAEDEIGTRLFTRASGDLHALQSWLKNLEVYGNPLAVRLSADGSELSVSGPPLYLARIQQHLDQSSKPVAAADPVRGRSIRIFRGGTVSQVNP
ncbi:type III secretion protein [Pseudomonas fluorescens]|jgi:type III secretion protein C|uniref:type III secretion protein n=1 Tax=Pseudomonas fluorescens TaxID=294 RepID=UPI0037F62A64